MKFLLFPLLFLYFFSFGQPLYISNPYDCSVFSNSSKYQIKHRENINFHASLAPQNNGFPSGANTGCLNNNGINNWILIKIDSLFSGDTLILNFSNSKNVDLDGAVYGPLINNDPINACSSTFNPVYSCENDANPISTILLPDVQVGQIYVLVINNYFDVSSEITLRQPVGGYVDFYLPKEIDCEKPVGSISGTQTIQLGQSLNLLNYFAPINEWRSYYTTNLGGWITGSSSYPTTHGVQPTTSTLYELTRVSNNCGNGKANGFAVVNVCQSDSAISLIARKNSIFKGDSTELILSSERTLPYNFNITNYGSGIATSNPFTIKIYHENTQSFELFDCGIECENSNAVTVVVEENVESKKLVACFSFDNNLNDNTFNNTILGQNIQFDVNRNSEILKALKIENNTSLNLSSKFILTEQYSVSFWLKPNYSIFENDSTYLFSLGQKNGEQSLMIERKDGSFYLVFKSYNSLKNFEYLKVLIPSISIFSDWNLLTITKSNTALSIFLNDIRIGNKSLVKSETFYASNMCKIGSYFNNFKKYNGLLDDLRIFNGSLIEEEIRALYSSTTCEFNYQEKRKPELISCYPFDGNANDQVNSNHGKISGATLATDRFGNQNSAYYLNGNSYISLPNWSLNLQSYSVSGWVKMGNTSSNNTIFNFGGDEANAGSLSFSEISYYPNIIKFKYFIASGDLAAFKTDNIITSPEYYVNNWFHFVIVREPNFAKLYINGQIVGKLSTSNNTHSFFEHGNGFRAVIGANAFQRFVGFSYGFNQYFKGYIDDFKIFSGAILDSDVIKLFTENRIICNYKYCPDYISLPKSYYFTDKNINGKIQIESSEFLPFNTSKSYFSEKSIILQPGFSTSDNNIFRAEILNCN